MFRSLFYISREKSFAVFLLLLLSLSGCADKREAGSGYISLSPAVTEIIYDIGAESNLLARTEFCDWPEEALLKPSVGGFDSPSIELIVSLNPEVVFAAGISQTTYVSRLRSLGYRVVDISPGSIDELSSSIALIGDETGYPAEAASSIKRLETRLNNTRKTNLINPPLVYAEISADPMMAAGLGSYINDIIEFAGGKNAAAEERDYFLTGYEYIIRARPDIIILLDPVPKREVSITKNLGPLSNTAKVVRLEVPDIYIRPGPRVYQAIESLSEIIEEWGIGENN